MKQSQRALLFFSAMLMTFGITSFDFQAPDFQNNGKEYVVILCGIILLGLYFLRRAKDMNP